MNGTIRTMDRLRNVALGLGGVAHTAAVETVAPPLLRGLERSLLPRQRFLQPRILRLQLIVSRFGFSVLLRVLFDVTL